MCRWAGGYLLKVAVLAGPLLGVLAVDDVQRSLPLFRLQALNLRLQLAQLLALLHVLHPEHGQTAGGGTVYSMSLSPFDGTLMAGRRPCFTPLNGGQRRTNIHYW